MRVLEACRYEEEKSDVVVHLRGYVRCALFLYVRVDASKQMIASRFPGRCVCRKMDIAAEDFASTLRLPTTRVGSERHTLSCFLDAQSSMPLRGLIAY